MTDDLVSIQVRSTVDIYILGESFKEILSGEEAQAILHLSKTPLQGARIEKRIHLEGLKTFQHILFREHSERPLGHDANPHAMVVDLIQVDTRL